MIKLLREKVQLAGEQVVTFGKYKSWMYKEISETYLKWAIKETDANTNASPDLVKLANWAKEDLQKRATQARVAGAVPASEDPEVKAKYPPPPMSLSGSSASWSMVSGDYTSQREREHSFRRETRPLWTRLALPRWTWSCRRKPKQRCFVWKRRWP